MATDPFSAILCFVSNARGLTTPQTSDRNWHIYFYKYENWLEFHYRVLKFLGNTKYVDDYLYPLALPFKNYYIRFIHRGYISALHECQNNHHSINQSRIHPVSSSCFKYSSLWDITNFISANSNWSVDGDQCFLLQEQAIPGLVLNRWKSNGPKVFLDCLILNLKALLSFRTSVATYQLTLHDVAED